MVASKMNRKYIIDGNNLIGKHSELKRIDKKSVREALAYKLERYFNEFVCHNITDLLTRIS